MVLTNSDGLMLSGGAMKRFIFIILVAFIFSAIGNAETKIAIKPSELNPVILNDVKKNYSGWIIIEAFKINNRNIFTYEVILQKGQNKVNLYYDSKGGFIRKQSVSLKKPPAKKKVKSVF
jgi:hypothetical protein